MRPAVLFGLLGCAALAACGSRPDPSSNAALDGDASRGRQTLAGFGCGSCHTIPGVKGARGVVAPPLTAFSQRSFIAGQTPNTRENLVRWIMDPQSLAPGTAMPDLSAPEPAARDMAAYLLTLR